MQSYINIFALTTKREVTLVTSCRSGVICDRNIYFNVVTNKRKIVYVTPLLV